MVIETRSMTATGGSRCQVRALFDVPAAWPVIFPRAEGGIGGAEVRAVTFAGALAKRPDFDVRLLVKGQMQGTVQTTNGMTVQIEPPSSDASNRQGVWRDNVRRLSDRLSGSFATRWSGIPPRQRFVEHLEYDVLCCFGVHNRTASLVRTARESGRRAVVFLTSDRTLDDLQLQGRSKRGAYGELGCLCRYALQHADAVVVQKRSQQAELLARLGVSSHLIRNPVDLNGVPSDLPVRELPAGPFALWVGRADTFSKRADRCWQLARQCPEISFVAIMNVHDDKAFAELKSTRPTNVTLVPRVPCDEIEAYFRRATLLINTSDREGFPNAFLQAGKYGVPIVSLKEDPDGMLGRYGGGVCCYGNLATMQSQIRQLMKHGSDYQRMSRKVQQYTREFHGLEPRADELAALLRDVPAHRQVA